MQVTNSFLQKYTLVTKCFGVSAKKVSDILSKFRSIILVKIGKIVVYYFSWIKAENENKRYVCRCIHAIYLLSKHVTYLQSIQEKAKKKLSNFKLKLCYKNCLTKNIYIFKILQPFTCDVTWACLYLDYYYPSSHQRCSVKQGVLRNFAKFTGKHLRQNLFFNKVAGAACNFIWKETLERKREFCLLRCINLSFATWRNHVISQVENNIDSTF